MTTYPEWRAMWDKRPWRPTTDDIDVLLTEIDRHTTPADPPTSRWTVDGNTVVGEGDEIIECYVDQYPKTIADADLAEQVAAALNAGRPDPADTEPTAEQQAVIDLAVRLCAPERIDVIERGNRYDGLTAAVRDLRGHARGRRQPWVNTTTG